MVNWPYLNNRVFLSRDYRLIVDPRKFEVTLDMLKTNFQGATIRPIVPRHKHTLLSLLFTTKFSTPIYRHLSLFSNIDKITTTNQCKRVLYLWRPGSVKIERYYAKNGRLMPTAKRGKEVKQQLSTVFCIVFSVMAAK